MEIQNLQELCFQADFSEQKWAGLRSVAVFSSWFCYQFRSFVWMNQFWWLWEVSGVVELRECCDILAGCPPNNYAQLSKSLSRSSCALLMKGGVTAIPRISQCVFPLHSWSGILANKSSKAGLDKCFYPIKLVLLQWMLHQEEKLPFSLEKPQFSSLEAFYLLGIGLFRLLGLTESSVCKWNRIRLLGRAEVRIIGIQGLAGAGRGSVWAQNPPHFLQNLGDFGSTGRGTKRLLHPSSSSCAARAWQGRFWQVLNKSHSFKGNNIVQKCGNSPNPKCIHNKWRGLWMVEIFTFFMPFFRYI